MLTGNVIVSLCDRVRQNLDAVNHRVVDVWYQVAVCFYCVSVRHYQNDCYITVSACLLSKMAHLVCRVQERTKERLNCTNLNNEHGSELSLSFFYTQYLYICRQERKTKTRRWHQVQQLLHLENMRRITCSCSLFICKTKKNKKNNLNRKSLVALFSFSFFAPLILQIWLTIKQVHKKYTIWNFKRCKETSMPDGKSIGNSGLFDYQINSGC